MRHAVRIALPLAAALFAAVHVRAETASAPAPPPADGALGEATAFAERIEAEIAEGNLDGFLAAFDVEAMLNIALRGLEDGQSEGLLQGFRAGGIASSRESLATNAKAWLPPASFELLRVVEVDGKPRAIFRILPEAGGVNYVGLVIARRPAGGARIVDVWVATAGSLQSEIMRDIARESLARAKAGREGQQSLQAIAADQQALAHAAALVRDGKGREALSTWAGLSESTKAMKPVAVLRVLAATSLADAGEIDRAVTAYRKAWPGDAALDLLLIDDFLNKSKWDETLASIDRIDAVVGGDPWLSFMRANVCAMAERWPDVTAHARKAIAAGSSVEDAHWLLVTAGLRQESHAEVARLLGIIETELGIELGDLREVPDYAAFVKSEPGRAFVAARWK